MTARFVIFREALMALCAEHNMHLFANWDGGIEVCDGVDGWYGDGLIDNTAVPPTPEELAFIESERAAERMLHVEFMSPAYLALVQQIGDHAEEERAKHMRISTDPADPAYIDDRPRRVKSNDVEIADWLIADEFRRCVITKDGKLHNGAVWIERLPDPAAADEKVWVDAVAETKAEDSLTDWALGKVPMAPATVTTYGPEVAAPMGRVEGKIIWTSEEASPTTKPKPKAKRRR